jgi:hypothetical protein
MKVCLIFFSVIVLWGCEKQIPYKNSDFEKKLVVNATLEADKYIVVSVSSSVNPVQNPTLNNIDGEVTYLLLEDSIHLDFNTLNLNEGLFFINYKPKPGSIYELQIACENYPSVKMIDTVPLEKPIFKIDTLIKQNTDYKLKFSLQDNAAKQIYMVAINVVGREIRGTDTLITSKVVSFLSNDKVFLKNINNATSYGSFGIFDDQIFNGSMKVIELEFTEKQLVASKFIPEKIELRVSNISQTMFDYYVGLLENNHIYGGPLATYSLNNGNVQDGLGLFSFYNSNVAEIAIP